MNKRKVIILREDRKAHLEKDYIRMSVDGEITIPKDNERLDNEFYCHLKYQNDNLNSITLEEYLEMIPEGLKLFLDREKAYDEIYTKKQPSASICKRCKLSLRNFIGYIKEFEKFEMDIYQYTDVFNYVGFSPVLALEDN